jgi:hypothetical protein
MTESIDHQDIILSALREASEPLSTEALSARTGLANVDVANTCYALRRAGLLTASAGDGVRRHALARALPSAATEQAALITHAPEEASPPAETPAAAPAAPNETQRFLGRTFVRRWFLDHPEAKVTARQLSKHPDFVGCSGKTVGTILSHLAKKKELVVVGRDEHSLMIFQSAYGVSGAARVAESCRAMLEEVDEVLERAGRERSAAVGQLGLQRIRNVLVEAEDNLADYMDLIEDEGLQSRIALVSALRWAVELAESCTQEAA